MKDKKPLYCVLSLKGLGGDIESRVSQSHLWTKQARLLPLFKECGKDIPSNRKYSIPFHTCHQNLLLYSSVECQLKAAPLFWVGGDDPKWSWEDRSGCLIDEVTRSHSFSGLFIHSSTDTRVLPPIHLATHHSSTSPPRHPSSIHPSSLHRPAFHPPTHRLSIIPPSLLFTDPFLISHWHNSKWDFFSPKLNQKRKKFNTQPFPYLSSHEFFSKLSYFK